MRDEQERLAREWAESKLAMPASHLDADVIAAAEHILATTTAPLSMADVEWEDEKHNLAGATTPRGNDVVMMWHDGEYPGNIITGSAEWATKDLTPNGKRYELREVSDEHPTALYTVEDYENAPAGTIVAPADRHAWTKTPSGAWRQGKDCRTSREMAGAEREMLRWGWGE